MQPGDYDLVGWGHGMRSLERMSMPEETHGWHWRAWLHAVCQQRTRPKTLTKSGNDARHVVAREEQHRRAEHPDRCCTKQGSLGEHFGLSACQPDGPANGCDRVY